MPQPHTPKKLKIVYVISDIDKALAFEWIARWLASRAELSFILIGHAHPALRKFLEANGIACRIVADEAFPTDLKKVVCVYNHLRALKPDIVHTHLWRASLIGIPLAWLLRIPKRIFTRHHAMLHYREFPSGRKWDRLINFLATDIIAVSGNVKNILVDEDRADPRKIRVIHHGFDLKYFQDVTPGEVERLRNKYTLRKDAHPVVGIIARYLEWKGIHFGIAAFRKLLIDYPSAHLILANAGGNYAGTLREMLATLPKGSYTEIAFEQDLAALYQLFDVYLHTPVDEYSEAFGQTYVEALAAGIPSIFTLSGVAPDFIIDRQNALVVGFQDADAIFRSMKTLMEDRALRDALVLNGKQDSLRFSLDNMFDELAECYHLPK